ncbi:MAG: glutathione synthase [Methylococcales symbiont of Hymedesmia sp. n. MRB-2018]|nr:MAG: glutathione synthase [Methylococcales symbiont of Hymedesmia sp. n. MRB-2018]KAF3984545.1 MAG: glutathione synthase [Methylococcales symbiont of Hymedesmia sp. n. MRB-2018]
MTIKFGMVMDSIDQIKINKETSFAMLLEAQSRGWEIHYMELNDLYMSNGKPYARTRLLQVQRDPNNWYDFIGEQEIALENLDTIIMRKDPPFNQEYIYATYLLEHAEQKGTYLVNKPQSLRDANEKLFTAWFPQCCADTLVAREPQRFKQFLQQHKEMILKPLDGMGGTSIFHVRENDPNLNVILEIMTDYARRYIMAQRYIAEIKEGDKRILLINGEPVPYALARIPAKGESRGNLAAGGHAEGRKLSERDLWIANQVGPTLKKKGLVFVGIDVIGDFLTEINVTSPTCVQELDTIFGLNISAQLMDHIENTLAKKS